VLTACSQAVLNVRIKPCSTHASSRAQRTQSSRAQRTQPSRAPARNQAVLNVRIKSLDAHQVYNI
jgi:hypothetical protein